MKATFIIILALFGMLEVPATCAHSDVHGGIAERVNAELQKLAVENSDYDGCKLSAEADLKNILDDFYSMKNSDFRPSVIYLGFGGSYIISSYYVVGMRNNVPYIYLGKAKRYFPIPGSVYDSLVGKLSTSSPASSNLFTNLSVDTQNLQCNFVVYFYGKTFKLFVSVSDNKSMDFDVIEYVSSAVGGVIGDD